jgi:peroxisomal membrane protein 4
MGSVSPACSHESCISSSFRGLRNGVYYGAKIRLIHSFIMTMLFRDDPLIVKLKTIFWLTYEHSKNLGIYVFIYKSLCCLIRRLFKKDYHWIPFIAGIIGSYFMWAKKTPVNSQLMLYLLSRNLLAITNFFNKQTDKLLPNNGGFAISSILCWGVVMYLFERFPNKLQSSLFSSMDFLYNNSNLVSESWKDFVPFYIPKTWFEKPEEPELLETYN